MRLKENRILAIQRLKVGRFLHQREEHQNSNQLI